MQYQVINAIRKSFLGCTTKVCLCVALGVLLSACGGSGGSNSNGASSSGLSISGKITVQGNSDVDLDVNSLTTLNNDITDPQLITNPSTIGGYLSGSSGTYSGTTGNSFYEDKNDFFSVSLVEGQEIQLSVFQADVSLDSIELELALRDEFDQVQASNLIEEFNSNTLVVPADGLYTISLTVTPQTAPLLYTLSISQTISSQSLTSSDYNMLSHDFVPGEVLIKFKANNQQKSNAAFISNQYTHSTLLDKLVLKDTIPNIANVYQFQTNTVPAPYSITLTNESIGSQEIEKLDLIERKVQTLKIINQLKENEQVEYAEPNFIYHASFTTTDPRLDDQWNLSMLSTFAAWQVATGQGVTVAVLDTGIDSSHEDLATNILSEGYDFVSTASAAGDGDGIDDNPNDEGTSFHGSHVAGIIAAEADNAKGIAGLAYDAKIMPLRVLGVQDTGESSDIAQAILYAARIANTSGSVPTKAVDVINMSFGGEALSQTVKEAIDQAYAKGIILVAAAGNAATDKAFYPAAFDNVIGVGAVSHDKKRSSFSNYGVNVQVVAPGGTGSGSGVYDGFQDAILSTINANKYSEYIGTSMSAPHVSAVIALMKQLKSDLNGLSFSAALDSGLLTQDISGNSPDINNFYGKGLIDSAKAVNWAAGTTVIPAILNVYPTKLGFIGSNTEAELNLTNPGSGTVTIESIDEQVNWLEITSTSTDETTKLGRYLVEVNPALSQLDQATITINYRVNNGAVQQQYINVFISRSSQTDSTVGVLFVSLFKEEDIQNEIYQPVISVGGQLANGVYTYRFNSVPAGRYLLSASTDNDKDQISFDKGEAYGAYPLLSRPEYIDISNTSLTDMNFDINYPSFHSSVESLGALKIQNSKYEKYYAGQTK